MKYVGRASEMARASLLAKRAQERDPRVDWPAEYVRAVAFAIAETRELDAELRAYVEQALEADARRAMGDVVLPASVPMRIVNHESFEWTPREGRVWALGRKLVAGGVSFQVKGGVRFPNGREGVHIATGPKFDTLFVVPVEWLDELTEEAARGEG